MNLLVQVYEGDGVRHTLPRPQKPITKWRGRISFHHLGFPVYFDYEIDNKEQGGRITNQGIRFWCPGVGLNIASSYTYKGDPHPKVEGFQGNDGNNYMAITWEITKQTLIDIFMFERRIVLEAKIAHSRKFGKKRLR